MDFRKIARYVVNIASLIVGVLALPQLGALVPEAYLPAIAGVVATINMVLSLIRSMSAGETVLGGYKL